MWEILQGIGVFVLGLGLCLGSIVLVGNGVYAILYIFKRTRARRKRRHDRQHESKFPYRLVAYVFLGLALLTTVWIVREFFAGTFRFPDDVEAALMMIGLVLIFSVAAFRLYILQNMPKASEAIQNDRRPPVLYLRSFDQESLKFVHLKDEEKAKYNDFLNYAADAQLPGSEQVIYSLINGIAQQTANAPTDTDDITFEKYFRAELMQHIGPLVALGNPVDDLPAEGAYRDYQTDERWKDVFFERVRQCACIVMQLGSSNNLQFELTSILSLGLCHKLFILTQPQENVKDRYAWVRKYILREKPANWETFSEILLNNGYQLLEEPPGIGAVLTFEPDGRPIILVQRAFRPDEYVLPISYRLIDLTQRNLL
jgi:hypothetical protein